MSVEIHEGLPGSGKTLRMLSLIEKFITENKRSVYLFNFKLTQKGIDYFTALAQANGVGFYVRSERPEDFNVPFEKDSITGYVSLKFLDIEDGSTLVFDEAQEYFKSRGMTKEPPPPFVQMLPTHRHSGYNIHFITQNVMYLDIEIRRIADTYTKYSRLLKWGYCRLDIYGGVKENPIEQNQVLLEAGSRFKYPKRIFELYTSSVDHNVKARIPSKLKWFVFLIIFIAFLLYAIYYLFFGILGQLSGGVGRGTSSSSFIGGFTQSKDVPSKDVASKDTSVQSSSSKDRDTLKDSISKVESTPLVAASSSPPTSLGAGSPSVPDVTIYNIYYSGYFTTYTPINGGTSYTRETVAIINLLLPDGACSRVSENYFRALDLSLHVDRDFIIIFNVQRNVRHVLPLTPSPCVTNYVPPAYNASQQSPTSHADLVKSSDTSVSPRHSSLFDGNSSARTDSQAGKSASPYMYPSNPDSAPR